MGGWVKRYKPSASVVQDRMLKALKEAAKRGEAIPGDRLYEIAYPDDCEPGDWNAFQQQISRLNRRLEKEGHGDVAQSTVAYRLMDREVVRDYRRVPKRFKND